MCSFARARAESLYAIFYIAGKIAVENARCEVDVFSVRKILFVSVMNACVRVFVCVYSRRLLNANVCVCDGETVILLCLCLRLHTTRHDMRMHSHCIRTNTHAFGHKKASSAPETTDKHWNTLENISFLLFLC